MVVGPFVVGEILAEGHSYRRRPRAWRADSSDGPRAQGFGIGISWRSLRPPRGGLTTLVDLYLVIFGFMRRANKTADR